MAKRKTASGLEPAAAPARRQRRAAAAAEEEEEAGQPPVDEQPSTRRSTRRPRQQQADDAAAEADAAATAPPARRSARKQRQQQTQQQQKESGMKDAYEEQQDAGQEHQPQGDEHEEDEGAAAAAAAAAATDAAELDDFSRHADLATAVDALSNAAADPAAFLQPNANIAQAARQAAKALLQYTVTSCAEVRSHTAAEQQQQQQQRAGVAGLSDSQQQQQQLYVGEGFDSEQVWLQLDMQLAPLRKQLRRLMGQLGGDGAARQLVPPDVEKGIDAVLGEQGSGSEGEQQLDSDDDQEGGEEDGMDEEEQDGGFEQQQQQQQQQQQRSSSKQADKPLLPTEDRFFRLDDMEAFVAQAERQAAAGQDDDDDGADEDEDEEPIDFFGGTADSDDEAAAGAAGGTGSDLGSDDEDLEQLLNSSAALVGKQRQSTPQQQQQGKKRRGAAAGWGAGDSDEEGAEDVDPGQIYYKDFFGPESGLKERRRPAAAAAAAAAAWEQGEDDMDEGLAGGYSGDDDDGLQDDGAGAGRGSGEGLDDSDSDMDMAGGPAFESDEEDHAAAAAAAGRKGADKRVTFAGLLGDSDDKHAAAGGGSADEGEEEQDQPLSTHEKRLLRMQERIAEFEGAAMGEKPWHLVGEVSASARPLNSALEIDMDYDTTNRPPPAPTEEATQTLEDVIKRRIAEGRWDDVVRVLPPPTEVKKRQLVELDNTKAQQGLGEIYEAEYVQQAAGFTAPDKQEPMRRQAVALFKALCGKLDALSSFAFAPRPVVEELEVRSDVAALALEEVAPLAVSDATLRTPGEVFKPEAQGHAKAEAELTQEERKRRRAKKKRTHKAKETAKEAEAAARAAASGDATALAGRKSLAKQLAAATSSGLIKKGVVGDAAGGKSDYGKSTTVFGKLAEQQAAGKAGKERKQSSSKEGQQLKGSMLKL